MRIERVKEIAEVLKCLPYEREIRRKGRDDTRESKMLTYFQALLPNPHFGFWIAYDDNDKILGYTCGLLNPIPEIGRLHILRIHAKDKEVFRMFEQLLREWARPYKINIAQITTKNHIKGLQRLLGYVPVSVNLERRY